MASFTNSQARVKALKTTKALLGVFASSLTVRQQLVPLLTMRTPFQLQTLLRQLAMVSIRQTFDCWLGNNVGTMVHGLATLEVIWEVLFQHGLCLTGPIAKAILEGTPGALVAPVLLPLCMKAGPCAFGPIVKALQRRGWIIRVDILATLVYTDRTVLDEFAGRRRRKEDAYLNVGSLAVHDFENTFVLYYGALAWKGEPLKGAYVKRRRGFNRKWALSFRNKMEDTYRWKRRCCLVVLREQRREASAQTRGSQPAKTTRKRRRVATAATTTTTRTLTN